MSVDTLITAAPSPIIPVADEPIEAPANVPEEQQRKIAAYNELFEVVYLHKIELESLEGDLVSMKAEIEGDLEYLALKEAGLKAQRRKSGATAVAAFVRSRSPVPMEDNITSKANPNAMAKRAAAAIVNMKSIAGTTKSVKSRGKGKGRQEKVKLNGMDLKYHKGRQISLDDDEYAYDNEEEEYYRRSSKTPSTEA